MNRRAFLSLGSAMALVPISSASFAQPIPPVDLGIPNIQQQGMAWCWLAVSEQIIRWKSGGQSPAQCQMASMVNNLPPPACCVPPNNPMLAQACGRSGGLQEIQALIGQFGHSYSQIAPPADPMILYQTLRGGRPVIVALQTTPYSGHVIVLRGMAWTPQGPVMIINDPMSYFTQPAPFGFLIANHWQAAIVVS